VNAFEHIYKVVCGCVMALPSRVGKEGKKEEEEEWILESNGVR